MTESEWLTCRNPWVMLSEIGYQVGGGRKLRLIACACCHRRLHAMCHPPIFTALMLAEQHLEQPVPELEIRAARERLRENLEMVPESAHIIGPIIEAIAITLQNTVWSGEVSLASDFLIDSWQEEFPEFNADQERAAQCDLVREIFGNPFRPAVLNLAGHTGTVISLAHAIYDTGDFARLPILADALEDAGCTDEAILRHCREPGQHVKGCWVVDLLLRK